MTLATPLRAISLEWHRAGLAGLLMLLAPTGAHAGSNSAGLSCHSANRQVRIEGRIPATELALDLILADASGSVRILQRDHLADMDKRRNSFRLKVSGPHGFTLVSHGRMRSSRSPGRDRARFQALLTEASDVARSGARPPARRLTCLYEYSI